MSAATASSTETVHVRITNEAVNVWRPVSAQRLSASVYRLSEALPPEDEAWSFGPGEDVVVEPRGDDGTLVAVARAIALDEPSAGWVPEAA